FPINKRKDEIKRYLGLKLKEKIESLCLQVDAEWEVKIKQIKQEMPDGGERREKLIEVYGARDEIKNYIKSNTKKDMNEYFKNREGITSKNIYLNLFRDKELFEIATLSRVSYEEFEIMKDEVLKNGELGIIDEDDLAPRLYINLLLEGV
ncbi:hypothetical protein NQ665_18890, partial [Acinetobacter baumannii]|nr:hypothetical protein [Acinetobacter baumannii]